MFDILTDVWSHPGAAHAPIVPFNISKITADSADAEISSIHKYGIDTLMLVSDKGDVPSADLLNVIFAAAAKRYMLIFVHESVVTAAMGCEDASFTAYNPMLASHRLVLKPAGDAMLSPFDEAVAEVSLKLSDGVVTDAVFTDETPEGYEAYRFVQTSAEGGIDLLCPETVEMLIFGAYEAFVSEYKEASAGTLVGLICDRLAEYNTDEIFWSYDMLRDFLAVGGDAKMLASLLMPSEKRATKEGLRLYRKALSASLESTFCRPASEWCGRNSLAFAGEVPYRFASNCGRRFTLPVWSREGYADNCKSDNDIISGVRFLADVARGEGFTGAGYKASSTDADSLMRELHVAFAASAAIVFLPEEYSSSAFLESSGVRREDMRRMCTYIKRMSTLGTSCGSKTSCAVLCDDEFIPFSGAEKLRELGVDFNFISKAQIMERGSSHHGELLIDKFRYSSLLIDQRIRLEPTEVMKIGEFASHDGKMYRGGAFGDFAKKTGLVTDFGRECAAYLIKYETLKCTCPHLLLVNRTDAPVTIRIPYDREKAGYYLDSSSGKKYPLDSEVSEGTEYTSVRVSPYSTAVFAWDPDNAPNERGVKRCLSQVYALGCGDNTVEYRKTEESRCVIEIDAITGKYCDVSVDGKDVERILYPPYTADISKYMSDGECTVTLKSDGDVVGAVVRMLDVQ